MSDAIAKAEAYRERAKQMRRKAEIVRTEELRRAYLLLARDWEGMADRMVLKSLEKSPPWCRSVRSS